MNLRKKKSLASRTLKVGKGRIVFLKSRINEIKEAITKQDIRDLKNSGAIAINEIKGRKKIKVSKKKGPGKIKKKVNKRKQTYVIMTRKLRNHLKEIKKKEEVSRENYYDIRKKIKNRFFRSKAHLKEYLKDIEK